MEIYKGARYFDNRSNVLSNAVPQIMGILNITPDSFSDGGHYCSVPLAIERALKMVEQGATIIDIGGESTRPYAKPVSIQEELDRVLPVIEALHKENQVRLSIDSSKPEVIRAAVGAGVSMINDVRALTVPGALETVSALVLQYSALSICLMHTSKEPSSMQDNPYYENVIQEVYKFLAQRVDACIAAGIKRECLIIDPGIGFGKTASHNLQLLHYLEIFQKLNLPILIGISRKSMLAAVLASPIPSHDLDSTDKKVIKIEDRLYAALAATTIALLKGASIIRTHDVKATYEAMKITYSILCSEPVALDF